VVRVFKVILRVLALSELLHHFEALVTQHGVVLFAEPGVPLVLLQEVFLMLLLVQNLVLFVFGLQMGHVPLLAILELRVGEEWL